jgi:type IV pilus assembly protein PilW
VLLRSADDNLATRAQTYMDCNGANVTAADRRIRRTYTATFNLRNR